MRAFMCLGGLRNTIKTSFLNEKEKKKKGRFLTKVT
jgi:hypothetical protein